MQGLAPPVKPPMPGKESPRGHGMGPVATSAYNAGRRSSPGGGASQRSSSQIQRANTAHSIMAGVRNRIRDARRMVAQGANAEMSNVDGIAPCDTGLPGHGGSLSRNASASATFARAATSISRIKSRIRPRCTISFSGAVFCPFMAIVLVSFGTLIPILAMSNSLLKNMSNTFEEAIGRQIDRITELYESTSYQIFVKTLDEIEMQVTRGVLEPPDRAVSIMWGAVRRKYHRRDPDGQRLWQPEGETFRRHMAQRAWEELNNQWSCTDFQNNVCSGTASSVYIAVNEQQVMGSAFYTTDVNLDSASQLQEQRLFDSNRWDQVNVWNADQAVGERKQDTEAYRGAVPYIPSDMPFYQVQHNLSMRCQRNPAECPQAKKMWSEIFILDNRTAPWVEGQLPELAISWTVPVILPADKCDNYTCFKGVIAADIMLRQVRETLSKAWVDLHKQLANFKIPIDNTTSSIFIMNEVSRNFPEQEGLLIGTSAADVRFESVTMSHAVDSSSTVVAGAARAARAYKAQLRDNQSFQFSMDRALLDEYRPCDDKRSDNCYRAVLRRVSLDENDSVQWLVVVVVPAKPLLSVYEPEVSKIEQDVNNNKQRIRSLSARGTSSTVVSFFVVTVVCLLMIPITRCLILKPVKKLSAMMEKLSGYQADLQTFTQKQLMQQCRARKLSPKGTKEELMQRIRDYDVAQDQEDDSREFFEKLEQGQGGFVQEVKELQDGFAHLSHSIKVLERFIPSAVVNNLRSKTQREEREQASRINPKRRVVTIMFSDIKDFTTISEKLIREDRYEDLMFLTTWYLTEMIEVVEQEDGTVGEVLGDGLLAFWNTPNLDEDHAKKACIASIRQQQKVEELNAVLEQKNLPKLAIRIGLHTGEVFQGNLGVEFKRKDGTVWRRMKFGCMGDPVNLASRLEGLCKVYGVGVICSEATVQALPAGHGCFFRKLSVAQVKGKNEPTSLYELLYEHDVGIPSEYAGAGQQCSYVSEAKKEQTHMYESALDAWREARFADAAKILDALLKVKPNDAAAERLCKQSKELAEVKSSWRMLEAKKDLENWTGVEKMFDK